MPMGPEPIGFAAFLGVKLFGYTVFSKVVLNRAYSKTDGGFKSGAARTGIGLAAGAVYGGLWLLLKPPDPGYLFYLRLFPIRILEWGLLLRLFFEPQFLRTRTAWMSTIGGTFCSYLLDAVGVVAAFVVPGGMWVC
jgi:hypothetical protein